MEATEDWTPSQHVSFSLPLSEEKEGGPSVVPASSVKPKGVAPSLPEKEVVASEPPPSSVSETVVEEANLERSSPSPLVSEGVEGVMSTDPQGDETSPAPILGFEEPSSPRVTYYLRAMDSLALAVVSTPSPTAGTAAGEPGSGIFTPRMTYYLGKVSPRFYLWLFHVLALWFCFLLSHFLL